MVWLLLAATVLLTALVAVLALLALQLRRRVVDLEQRASVAAPPSSDAPVPQGSEAGTRSSVEEPPAEFVITDLSRREHQPEPVPAVEPRLFADIMLRETVVQTASLWRGVRRGLSPEVRNRIRFEMRREIKRSRKQRRADLREARRQYQARQRAAIDLEPRDSAA